MFLVLQLKEFAYTIILNNCKNVASCGRIVCTFGNFCFDLVFNLLRIKLFLFTYLQKACTFYFLLLFTIELC